MAALVYELKLEDVTKAQYKMLYTPAVNLMHVSTLGDISVYLHRLSVPVLSAPGAPNPSRYDHMLGWDMP